MIPAGASGCPGGGQAAGPGGQAAGPGARVMGVVCDAPEVSVQVTLRLSPGWSELRMVEIWVGSVTVCPATEVITSPAASPAVAAGEPDRVPSTVAPEVVVPLPPVLPKPPSLEPPVLPKPPSLEPPQPPKPPAPVPPV